MDSLNVMQGFRSGRSRRVIAVLVALILAFWNVETLLADVCDGASTTAPCAIVSHSVPSPDSSAPPFGGVQVCHCQHVHSGLPVVFGAVMPTAEVHTGVMLAASGGIPPATAAPLFRPPIA